MSSVFIIATSMATGKMLWTATIASNVAVYGSLAYFGSKVIRDLWPTNRGGARS